MVCIEEGMEYFNFLNDKDFDDISFYYSANHLNINGARYIYQKDH